MALAVAASMVGCIAFASDVSQMTTKVCATKRMGKDDKSAFIREVTRLMSVMDACTHCQSRCRSSTNSNPSDTQLPIYWTLVAGPLMKAAGLRP